MKDLFTLDSTMNSDMPRESTYGYRSLVGVRVVKK
jgi:hypothetical protein